MKRLTAIIFVLLANICLLAHAVIPHHHHDRMAVAIVDMAVAEQAHHEHLHDSHHSHDHHSHYHHSHNHQESHQHSSQSEECLISETLAVLTRSQEFGFGDDGVEVVNSRTLYPGMLRRCKEEKLFIASNTDTHGPTSQIWGRENDFFRTMTFVMAKECTEEAIKEALLKRRTIGYAGNHLVGEKMWLTEFLNAAVDCKLVGQSEKERTFLLTNNCSVPFTLRYTKAAYTLKPFHALRITLGRDAKGKYLKPAFEVVNMWIEDEKHPTIELELDK